MERCSLASARPLRVIVREADGVMAADPADRAVPGATPAAGEVAPGKAFRTELNPVDFLHRAAALYPDQAAVVDGGRRYTYRQLAERSWRLANALRAAGLGKGDRVATLLFNSAPMLEAHFGVPAAGGFLVGLLIIAWPAPRSDTSSSTAVCATCCSTPAWRHWPRRSTWPASP